MYKNIFFLLFLVVFLFSMQGTSASAGIDDLLKLQSNDPIKVFVAWVQKTISIFPERGIPEIINQAIVFLEAQVQLRKSIFWIELEKEKTELYMDGIRLLKELGINL